MAVVGPVKMPPFDREPWPLGQGDIPLAEWLARMTCNERVWGMKPTWDLCASCIEKKCFILQASTQTELA